MIRYTHVVAKVDVYNQNNDIVCFACEEYDIVGIDVVAGVYVIEVEPEIGGYPRTMELETNDPDFYFLQPTTSIEEIIVDDFYEDEEW